MLGRIYCLSDPETNQVRYIGFTRGTLNNRFSQHKHEALIKGTVSHMYNWFRYCKETLGKLPNIELVEDNIPLDQWEVAETYWINQFDSLTNQRAGGCGVHVSTQGNGRFRSSNAKKKPVIQLSIEGAYIREWCSATDAENHYAGKVTGNVFRAVTTKATAYNFLWLNKIDYTKTTVQTFKGKHWKPVYLFCIFTHTLIKEYSQSTELTTEFNVNSSVVTQAIKNNLIFMKAYFVRHTLDISNPPNAKPIYVFEGKYYSSFTVLHKENNLPFTRVYWQKKGLIDKFIVSHITEDIVRSFRETFR